MRQQGTVVRWDEVKGFGFIRASGTQDIFFHVRDFRSSGGSAPGVGMKVDFETIHVGGKGPRARAVQPFGHVERPASPRRRAHARPPVPASGAAIALPLMLAYAATLVWGVWRKDLPWWLLPASFGLNLVTFVAYWQDRYAAQQRGWRISENTLHVWGVAGGWGGAWFAQQVLRHKSSKESFRAMYWFTVVVHCGVVALWAFYYRFGSER